MAVLKALFKRCIAHYLKHIKDMSPYAGCYQGAYLFMMLCSLNSSAFAALVFAALASLQNAQKPVKFLHAASRFRRQCVTSILCACCVVMPMQVNLRIVMIGPLNSETNTMSRCLTRFLLGGGAEQFHWADR